VALPVNRRGIGIMGQGKGVHSRCTRQVHQLRCMVRRLWAVWECARILAVVKPMSGTVWEHECFNAQHSLEGSCVA